MEEIISVCSTRAVICAISAVECDTVLRVGEVRATAAGVCYNVGRLASAAAPFIVGSLAASRGFGVAFTVAGAAFLVAALAWVGIPGEDRLAAAAPAGGGPGAATGSEMGWRP